MPSDALAIWKEELRKGLRALEERSLRRSLAEIHGVNLCSNDYLGLAEHPKLHEAAINAVTRARKVGGTGSRLRLSLTCRIPEEELDRLVGSLGAWRAQRPVLTTARRA
jgi:hypothetical protein